MLEYFLPLFPVFTSGANFPIIAITLTNNLKTLFYFNEELTPTSSSQNRRPSVEIITPNNRKNYLKPLFPLLSLILPFIISMASEDIESLVSIVGGYAGVAIQYIIPSMLVFYSRRKIESFSDQISLSNSELVRKKFLMSPFKGQKWVIFVLIWSIVCISFVTVNHIIVWTS